MKIFSRHLTTSEIQAKCLAQGALLDKHRYDEGDDHVVITLHPGSPEEVKFYYNVASGCFFGKKDGKMFHEGKDSLEGEAWYDEILAFVYEEAP